MCGRFTLVTTAEALADHYQVDAPTVFASRYNITPSQPVMALVQSAQTRHLTHFRWGLVPAWSKTFGQGHINARSETVATKPSFRTAIRRRRCLIPADGFYEWQSQGRTKQPYFFHQSDHTLFSFAGIWETWHGSDGSELSSCAILSTVANQEMQGIHERMPVTLQDSDYDLWLDPDVQSIDVITPLLQTAAQRIQLTMYPVSSRVNSPSHDDPQCREPMPQMEQGILFSH